MLIWAKAAPPKVFGKLLTQGLIEEVPGHGALPIWRRDEENGAVALRITRRGLAAIRIDEHRAFLEKAGAGGLLAAVFHYGTPRNRHGPPQLRTVSGGRSGARAAECVRLSETTSPVSVIS